MVLLQWGCAHAASCCCCTLPASAELTAQGEPTSSTLPYIPPPPRCAQGGNLCQRIYDRCKRRLSYLEILQVVPHCLRQQAVEPLRPQGGRLDPPAANLLTGRSSTAPPRAMTLACMRSGSA